MLVYQRATTPPMSISPGTHDARDHFSAGVSRAHACRSDLLGGAVERADPRMGHIWKHVWCSYTSHPYHVHRYKMYNIYIYIESIVIITLTPYINHWCWVVALISAARVARVPNPGCDPAKDAGGSWVVPTKKKERSCTLRLQWIGFMVDISLIYL